MFNREALCEEIQRRVAEWRRGGSPVSVVFVEIDEFAGLVESTGESVGTLVLEATTQFLTAAVREMDLVARYDNQTFGMLLPGATTAETIQVANRLHRAISRCAIPHDDGEVKFTVSIGLAESLEGDDAELLRTRAETALKSAVDAGRDAAHYHDGTTTAPIDEVGSTVA